MKKYQVTTPKGAWVDIEAVSAQVTFNGALEFVDQKDNTIRAFSRYAWTEMKEVITDGR